MRYAVTNAVAGDTIAFDSSLKGQTIVLSGTELTIDKSLTIDASSIYDTENDVPGLTIDADQLSRVLNIAFETGNVPVTLIGLAVVNGNTSSTGAGISCQRGKLTMTDCVVNGNGNVASSTNDVGGIYSYYSALTLTNCTIRDNVGFHAGGIYSYSSALTMTDCGVSGNVTSRGNILDCGGIKGYYCTANLTNCTVNDNVGSGISTTFKTLTMTDCVVSRNSGDAYGGGISCNSGGTLTNCTIRDNATSSYGGGIYNQGTLTLTRCTIDGNSGGGYGGGILNIGGVLTTTDCVVSGNTANQYGGGIYNNPSTDSSGAGPLTLTNTIVALNYNGDTFGSLTDSQNNILANNPGFVVAPVFDTSGKLTNAATLDLSLTATSWAINSGDNNFVTTETDYVGNTRIFDSTVDIGAYEYQEAIGSSEPVSLTVTTEEDSFDRTDGKTSLREAIFYATSGDRIVFSETLSGKTITLNGGELVMATGVAIDASSLPDGLTIDANQKSRVFNICGGTTDSPAVLIGLTVTGGKNVSYGCGIYLGGVLTTTNCTIRGNSYGIYCPKDGVLTMTNCVVSGNAGYGIYSSSSTLTMTNCVVCENAGNGIYSSSSTLTMTNCVVSGNTANQDGGGLYCSNGTATLTNCLVSGNTANRNGGGIYQTSYSALTLTNCTVGDNAANNAGGGIYNYSASNAIVTLKNGVVTLNTAGGAVNDIFQDTSNSTTGKINACNTLSSYADWSNVNDENVVNYVYDSTQPLFTDAANDDYTLAKNSQAIDKGNNAYAVDAQGNTLQYDLNGNARINDDIVDIGAYEYAVEAPSTQITTLKDVVNDHDGLISFREAILYATSGGTVTVRCAANNPKITLTSPILIDKDLTIDGTNVADGYSGKVTFDGGATSENPTNGVRLFEIAAEKNATVRNASFQNAYSATAGGAILNNGTLTVNNTDFTNNTAANQGGAIANSNSGTLTIGANTAFTKNNATRGGAVANLGSGKLFIDNSVNKTIDAKNNIVFSSNNAKNGGVLYNDGTDSSVTITGETAGDVSFSSNNATSAGGAIVNVSGTVNVTNVSFTGNTSHYGATSQDRYGHGGAIYNAETMTVTSSSFSGNKANFANGGALTNGVGGSLTLNDVTVENNEAYYGGGIINAGNLDLKGVLIQNNAAYLNGGGISNSDNNDPTEEYGQIKVIGTGTADSPTEVNKIINNTATTGFGGGIISVTKTSLFLTGASLTIKDNQAPNHMEGDDVALHKTQAWPKSDDPYIVVSSSRLSYAATEHAEQTGNFSLYAEDVFDYGSMSRKVTTIDQSLDVLKVQEGCSLLLSNTKNPLIYRYSFDVAGTEVVYQTTSVLSPKEMGLGQGIYRGTLELFDSAGKSVDFSTPTTITLEVEAVAPSFETKTADGLNGQIFRLNLFVQNISNSNQEWNLDWGDGTASRVLNQSDSITIIHYYAEPGEYALSLKAVAAQGNENDTVWFLKTHIVAPINEKSNLPVLVSSLSENDDNILPERNVQDVSRRISAESSFIEKSFQFASENDFWRSDDEYFQEYTPDPLNEIFDDLLLDNSLFNDWHKVK